MAMVLICDDGADDHDDEEEGRIPFCGTALNIPENTT